MEDVAPQLADKLFEEYEKSFNQVSTKYSKLLKKGGVDYDTAHNFSLEAYNSSVKAIRKTLTPDALSDERLYFNIAERTLKPLMEQGCKDVVNFSKEVQKVINENAGLKINPANVELDHDRIDETVSYAANAGKFNDVIDDIDSSMENLFQHMVDKSIETNAQLHHDMGLKPKIRRIAESGCCKWCSNLEGTYDYESVKETGNDVYRRHKHCRCVVLYEVKKGNKTERTNVWDKKVTTQLDVNNDYMGKKELVSFHNKNNKNPTSIVVYKNDKYSNIYNQTNSKNSQKMSEFINESFKNGKYGDVDKVIICKQISLGGIAAYNHLENLFFISEELIDEKMFNLIVDKIKFPSRNIIDVLDHELGGHKKHWESINAFKTKNNLSDFYAKNELEHNLRKYVVNQINNDRMYLSKVVSVNASKNFYDDKSLNETIADVNVLIKQNKITDDELARLVKEVLNYDAIYK